MQRQTFNKGMAFLQAAFPDFKGFDSGNTTTLEVYWQMLQDFHDKDFAVVVKQIVKTKKFFPKIAELREELLHLKSIRDDRTAAEEWAEILKAAEAGKDRPGAISAEAEKALAVVGGFAQFKLTDYQSLRFSFRRFEESYNGLQEAKKSRERTGGAELLIEKAPAVAMIEDGRG